MAETINMRELAAQVLLLAERGEQKGREALQEMLLKYQYVPKQERAFLSRLVGGVIEYQLRLDYVLNQFSNTPMHKCKPYIRCVLRLSAYQILFLSGVPVSAACNEAVKLVKKHGFSRLSGFVNGVLRTLAREKNTIVYPDEQENPVSYLSVMYSLPEWLVQLFMKQYGYEGAKVMAEASVKPAPLTVRFQQSVLPVEQAKQRMKEEGLLLTPIETNPALEERLGQELVQKLRHTAAYIEQVDYLSRYESFQNGYFTVQDVSSMLPGLLLEQVRMSRKKQDSGEGAFHVLDMCAAPGGKSCHIADLSSDYRVCSRDISDSKTERIRENVTRLKLSNVIVEEQDACVFTEELAHSMDAVLLDAPCSGLGVLGRKKEIAYNMTPQGIEDLIKLQRNMLNVACRYVKKGGFLLYSTCTVNVEENMETVYWFLEQHKDFQHVKQYQLLPGIMPLDGFYVAVLEKRS